MKYLVLLAVLSMTINLAAQPSEKEALRLLDQYEIIPGGQQTAASEMYPGEGMEIIKGSFLVADQNEFLISVPLVKGSKKSKMAFVAYRSEDGGWMHSAWFLLGYKNVAKTDMESDGLNEIIHEVEYIGRRMDKFAYRLISIVDDVEVELYQIEGFDLSKEARTQAQPEEALSIAYSIILEDLTGDGNLEINEEKREEYWVTEDMKMERSHNSSQNTSDEYFKVIQTIYQKNKKGDYVVVEPK